MIQVYENFLSQEKVSLVNDYALCSSYKYGERDNPHTPVVGLVHDVQEEHWVYELFHKLTKKLVPDDMSLERIYINCFAPSENPYYHIDNEDGMTFIYYVNGTHNRDAGGETQIVVDDVIKGIFPVPNRMLKFDANLWHRATAYRYDHRFTLAIKYGRVSSKTIQNDGD